MPWPAQNESRHVALLKVALVAGGMVPLARLLWLASQGQLGANPIEYITRSTGWWTLALLLATLSVTPVRRLTGWNGSIKIRRALGLLAFSYSLLHFTTYLWLDQFFDWSAIVKDIAKRPFITVGFSAFVLLWPLALTSSNSMVRKLGGRRWQQLHRLIYAIGVLGVVHFWWLVKKDIREPLLFAMILTTLLAFRLWHSWRKSIAGRPPTSRVT
jgi:methionine sulfoxide reductase heme-binding subunit